MRLVSHFVGTRLILHEKPFYAKILYALFLASFLFHRNVTTWISDPHQSLFTFVSLNTNRTEFQLWMSFTFTTSFALTWWYIILDEDHESR